MKLVGLMPLAISAIVLAAVPSSAQETREAYLARLKEVCAVECLTPRDLQRKARRRGKSDDSDMAVIMDVVFVRTTGDQYELFNVNSYGSVLLEVQVLGSAGIDTSQSSGVGGLPRSQRGVVSPNTVIVSLDKQAFSDFLNPPMTDSEGDIERKATDSEDILVEDDRDRKRAKPTLPALRSQFLNRRIVVRGKPVLTPQWVGGRLDRRRKQVTLMVDSVDDLVILPRYDRNGEPIPEARFAGFASLDAEQAASHDE